MSGEQLPPIVSAQLDALRFKTVQLLDAIQSLLAVVDRPDIYTPTWPDVLTKYNVILSISSSLSRNVPQALHRLALHPSAPVSEAALDSELSAVLRTQQTFAVLDAESETVTAVQQALGKRPIDTVRTEHDARVDRASRAVQMLRERFDWKARVEIPPDEEDDQAGDGPLAAASPQDVSMGVSSYALELGPGDVSFDGLVNAVDPDTDVDMEGDAQTAGATEDEDDEDDAEEIDGVLHDNGGMFTPEVIDIASTPGDS
ncbi:hypothetical protein EXIGLDRAFT_723090 [Exidia glandulosa HHB12029]|uniref:Mediator complex subunit 8 n=1 Tax=Exidia glandulosa HHB12029 TaxID=1314781 RepID=A0A165EYR2_EXIGL|nr:hypothetical protein EXIGLDRAFT_723090 [Exidia glandulosa HHB12029]